MKRGLCSIQNRKHEVVVLGRTGCEIGTIDLWSATCWTPPTPPSQKHTVMTSLTTPEGKNIPFFSLNTTAPLPLNRPDLLRDVLVFKLLVWELLETLEQEEENIFTSTSRSFLNGKARQTHTPPR